MNAKVKITRNHPLSIEKRVLIFVATAISLSLLLIGFLVQKSVTQHFAEQDADELEVITKTVIDKMTQSKSQKKDWGHILKRAVSGHHGVFFQVSDETGRTIYQPKELPEIKNLRAIEKVSIDENLSIRQWPNLRKTYRVKETLVTIDNDQYRILAGIDMDFHVDFLNRFQMTLWTIMLLAGAFTLLATWYGIHQGHSPLRRFSETIRDIQADRLHIRLDTHAVPSELRILVRSFNDMISRLEESFQRLSHFSADIAHELRTPLTNLITQTQVGVGKLRTIEEYQELLYSNLEEQERINKMVNEMLWLAKSEQGLIKPIRDTVNLKEEILLIFDFYEALAEEKGIILKCVGQSSPIVADKSMLRRAVTNILSNALNYAFQASEIIVSLSETQDEVAIEVKNFGPEIPKKDLERIFDRFYRVDPSRARLYEGSGLGLSITKSIVEAHKGKITVSSSSEQTLFTLRLPLVNEQS